jgi:hypothetical protein
MIETPPPRDDALTYVRPTPWWAKVGNALLSLAAAGALPAAGTIWLQFWFTQTFGGQPGWLQEVVDALPFGSVALGGSLVGLALLMIAVTLLAPGWVRRRYGTVEIHHDQLAFQFALAPSWAKQTVLAEQVTARVPTQHGLLLEVEDRRGWARWMFPLLVPVTDEAEQARVLARLDAALPDPEEAARVFGRGLPRYLVAGLVVSVLALAAPPVIVFAVRFSHHLVAGSLLAVVLPLVGIMAWFDAWFVQPRFRKLHLGRDALVLANQRIPYGDLTRVAAEEGELALEVGKKHLLLQLGDELPPALELLRERISGRETPLEVATVRPAWARLERRRRRGAAMIALTAALLAFDTAVAFSDPDVYAEAYVLDDDDQYIRVLYRVTDLRPRLVSLLEDPDDAISSYFLDDILVVPGLYPQTFDNVGERFRLDLVEGTGWHEDAGAFAVDPATTWHHVDCQGRRRAAAVELPPALTQAVIDAYADDLHQGSLPALLEPVLAGVDDPVVRAFLRGETSRRTYDLRDDDGGRLLWGVAHGEPVFAAVMAEALPLDLRVGVLRHEDVDLPGTPVSVRTMQLAWFESGSSEPIDLGSVPPLETLRRWTVEIEAGASVSEVSGPLVTERLRELVDATGSD